MFLLLVIHKLIHNKRKGSPKRANSSIERTREFYTTVNPLVAGSASMKFAGTGSIPVKVIV